MPIFLLDRPHVGVNVQFMRSHHWINSKHVLMGPAKTIFDDLSSPINLSLASPCNFVPIFSNLLVPFSHRQSSSSFLTRSPFWVYYSSIGSNANCITWFIWCKFSVSLGNMGVSMSFCLLRAFVVFLSDFNIFHLGVERWGLDCRQSLVSMWVGEQQLYTSP